MDPALDMRVLSAFEGVVDLGTLHAIISMVAAIAVIWAMQMLTFDACLDCVHGAVRFAQRLFMALLALGLLSSAATPMSTDTDPWPSDVLISLALALFFIATGIVNMARHRAGAANSSDPR
jgi:hypothetical protein